MDWGDPDTAKKYRDKAEALTGPFALHLVRQCGLDSADGSKELVILNNACGTGIVTHHIYEILSPAAKAKLQVGGISALEGKGGGGVEAPGEEQPVAANGPPANGDDTVGLHNSWRAS